MPVRGERSPEKVGAWVSILGFALVSTAIAVAIVLGRPVSAWHALLVLAFGVLVPGLSAHAIAMARELRRNADP